MWLQAQNLTGQVSAKLWWFAELFAFNFIFAYILWTGILRVCLFHTFKSTICVLSLEMLVYANFMTVLMHGEFQQLVFANYYLL